MAQTLSGTKTGVLSQTITCNSVQAALALTPNGSAGPAWGVTAPAGLTVTAIASNVFTVANSFSAAPGCGGSGDGSGVDPIVCIADPFLPKLSVRAKYRAQELCPSNPARRGRGAPAPCLT